MVIGLLSGCATRQNLPRPVQAISKRVYPSNDRNWTPEMARLAWARTSGSRIKVHNIRNNQYVTETEFVPQYYDREFDISQIQSVDYIVVPFDDQPNLAHTMLSFGLDDGSYISVSAEVRKEVGETYNVFKGLARQYELMYVVGDERDLVRLRSNFRGNNVYAYPTVANAAQAQRLFSSMMGRVNKLAAKPEFYNTLTNNCTTNIRRHINEIKPNRIANAWQVLLPGHSDKYAYDLGLLDQRIPFEDLKSLAHVNRLASQSQDSEDFSNQIRTSRRLIDRLAQRQEIKSPAQPTRGGQYLESVKLR
jgi:hypothetical protein